MEDLSSAELIFGRLLELRAVPVPGFALEAHRHWDEVGQSPKHGRDHEQEEDFSGQHAEDEQHAVCWMVSGGCLGRGLLPVRIWVTLPSRS